LIRVTVSALAFLAVSCSPGADPPATSVTDPPLSTTTVIVDPPPTTPQSPSTTTTVVTRALPNLDQVTFPEDPVRIDELPEVLTSPIDPLMQRHPIRT
jgi:hypothetical protein